MQRVYVKEEGDDSKAKKRRGRRKRESEESSVCAKRGKLEAEGLADKSGRGEGGMRRRRRRRRRWGRRC